jgi:hypothetical protein
MFRLLILLSFLGCISPVFSQTKARPTPEPCQVSQPPTFRGFHLNETPKQINELIPGFQEAYDEAEPDSTEKGRVVSSGSLFDKESGKKPPRKEYEDAQFIWHFFDDKLFFLVVKYTEFEPSNIQDFVKQLATKLQLPINAWTFADKYHATLKCNGFKIELWTGNVSDANFDKDLATVMLTDSVAEAEQDRRSRVEKARQQQLEQERIRLERERKRIFNP